MIKPKTSAEIATLKIGGQHLASLLAELKTKIAPGLKTADLEVMARSFIAKWGDKPAFLGYRPEGAPRPYPAALCVSVNEEIVHGLPSERILKEGDIVGLDCGLIHNGLYTDMAITVPVGKISKEAEKMVRVVEEALEAGIWATVPGKRVGDVSVAIEKVIKGAGFNVVQELAGHGVGYSPHEDPFVPNYGKAGTGPELVPGLVLAIEPMLTSGSGEIDVAPDEFTFITSDGHLATHAEKTIVVTETGSEIITKL